ncbi:MAG: hypothetical protein ACI9R3_001084, partial [Verrucomicrobiales bacterium]
VPFSKSFVRPKRSKSCLRIAVVHSATPRAIHKLRFGALWSALVLTALFYHETRSLLKKLRQAEALQIRSSHSRRA